MATKVTRIVMVLALALHEEGWDACDLSIPKDRHLSDMKISGKI